MECLRKIKLHWSFILCDNTYIWLFIRQFKCPVIELFRRSFIEPELVDKVSYGNKFY